MKPKIRELELKVLYEICQIIGQALNLDQTLDAVLSILSGSLSMKRATVTVKDEEMNGLRIRASHDLSAREKNRGVYREDEGVTGLIFSTAQPFVVPDISKEPLFLDKTRSRRFEKGRISFIGVPILLHNQPIGVLNVDRLFDEEVSYEEDVRFLTIVATLISQFVSLNRQVKEREAYLRRENRSLKAEVSQKYNDFFMVGKSPAMIDVQHLIEKVAPSKASILLLGESGTGKTLIARIIHELSSRAQYPFIKTNCASLPETLLESELFGYEKGAFTGASTSKSGRFEDADGGSIFLDEIGELPLNIQVKLLRFLQEREFERLGSTRTRKVDVRIITATNKDLKEAISKGGFREDLFYRLNVFPIRVPPLRERREDIALLVTYFLEKASREYGKKLYLTPRSMGILMRYDWPGNVREMENLIERMAIMADTNRIELKDLPSYLFSRGKEIEMNGPSSLSRLEEIERREILAALERNNWIQSQAAKELGLTLRQVGYRIKKFGIENLITERRGRNAIVRARS